MTDKTTAAVVLAAGLGTRMKSARPKVLHEVAGRPMVCHVLDALRTAAVDRTVVVIGPEMGAVAAAVAPAATALQAERLGTAHAVLAARDALTAFGGDILVLFGDTPLLTAETIAAMRRRIEGPDRPAVVVLGFQPRDPAAYGRVILAADGSLAAIVEYKDATEAERRVPLCNSGVMALRGDVAWALLDAVGNANAKGEYYLTDVVAIARRRGLGSALVEVSDEGEVMGVNARAELAVAEAIMQDRLRSRAMANGATLIDPASVHLSWDTTIGRDVTIGPHVFFGRGVRIGDDVDIRAYCHIEGATVEPGAIVGPFARLRPGARIGRDVHIGNFVEIKEALVETGAKVNHLTYVGDARVGAGANVGAGTITCNYDGFAKHRTDIGAGAFIGSNAALVAPVTIGDGAVVGAGSVITGDVPADALVITRAPVKEVAGWAAKNRARKGAGAAKRKPAATAPRSDTSAPAGASGRKKAG
ncbi:MAG: bifunctional UDP-N-acetylglucosamine diphosphorylase/glucosamine-1-phosphate N-acetyltransferase GlmU [Alphaproteobacteria bacterium]|nr:bifunctional UDP-N-acetylglucosamine diphosphorylase/glucosamine-1-phosphate N-acetyltransferase GlmU [Alphaproteobacteria bacterium]